jgi:hypothetical protein
MAAIADVHVAHPVHIFDEIHPGQETSCELCKEQPAAYHWTEKRNGKVPLKHDLVVCRVCAGMILLIGKND